MISARNNRTLSDLVHAHVGRPAIVLGGAPCWPEDYERVRAWPDSVRAVVLAANDHAFRRPIEVDYIVACDNHMRERLVIYRRPIISPRHWADYRVLHQVVSNSAALAAVAAWVMGCAPIIVCGVELYAGDTYAHDPKAPSVGKTISVPQHLRRWEKLTAATPGAQIRPVDGPLLALWPRWDPLEASAAPAPAESIRRIVAGERVVIERDVPQWHGTSYARHQVVETRKHEADELVKLGLGRRYREARA